jgi:hypothetical protein
MSDKPISDLRRRLIADMTVRSFSDRTKHAYIHHVETLAQFLGRSPDTATRDDVRRFQLHQVEQGAQPPKIPAHALFDLVHVDKRRLHAQIWRALQREDQLAINTPSTSLSRDSQLSLARILVFLDVVTLFLLWACVGLLAHRLLNHA